MIFSSYEFIFAFLPAALVVFHVARKLWGGTAALGITCATSLFFYSWWNPPYLFLLIGSLVGNFAFAKALSRRPSGRILSLAIIVNLLVLGYFKYRGFFLENVGFLVGETWRVEQIILPLGVSFFTFQQISLLIDVRLGRAQLKSPLDYVFFVSFFPQLIAGPVVLYREMGHQIEAMRQNEGPDYSLLPSGIVIFGLGLFKKVVLADFIGQQADLVFARVHQLTMLEAWYGVLAFTMQLYFDFSGYADMAVGLGLMFGFVLPINFRTPYRATSIIDFWQRWHITMTRFFMNNVYMPLSLVLTRYAARQRLTAAPHFLLGCALPIFVTFLLAGLWHGAGWTFVMLGAVHGAALAINLGWRRWKMPSPPAVIGWLLTMLTLMISLVFFRAQSFDDAWLILGNMFLPSRLFLPDWLATGQAVLGLPLTHLGIFPSGSQSVLVCARIAVLLVLSMTLPELTRDVRGFSLGWRTAFATAATLLLGVVSLTQPRAFIYFQF